MTAEEVLKSKLTIESIRLNNSDYTFNKVIEAMELYAEQFAPKWISVEDRLPEIDKNAYSYNQYVKVIGYWNNNWAEFYYCRREVRGKFIERFEWHGRISPFKVEYWMIPKPPKQVK